MRYSKPKIKRKKKDAPPITTNFAPPPVEEPFNLKPKFSLNMGDKAKQEIREEKVGIG